MATSNGISGLAVAVAAGGAVLVYAGFRGVSPLQALRDTAGGKPPPVVGTPTVVTPTNTGVTGSSGLPDSTRAAVVAAAQKYRNDIYNQFKRAQPGYSDCSSFVDKALKDAGIKPPFSPWANTANYRMSPEWKTIPTALARPGDIALSSGHMVLVTAEQGTAAIGQQRTNVNVRTGTVSELMGTQSYVYKTWTGYKNPDNSVVQEKKGGGSW